MALSLTHSLEEPSYPREVGTARRTLVAVVVGLLTVAVVVVSQAMITSSIEYYKVDYDGAHTRKSTVHCTIQPESSSLPSHPAGVYCGADRDRCNLDSCRRSINDEGSSPLPRVEGPLEPALGA